VLTIVAVVVPLIVCVAGITCLVWLWRRWSRIGRIKRPHHSAKGWLAVAVWFIAIGAVNLLMGVYFSIGAVTTLANEVVIAAFAIWALTKSWHAREGRPD
jgi:hypothetical protein